MLVGVIKSCYVNLTMLYNNLKNFKIKIISLKSKKYIKKKKKTITLTLTFLTNIFEHPNGIVKFLFDF